ncbi:MAG: regulatory protein RecX [Vicinamibacterales bacterium]
MDNDPAHTEALRMLARRELSAEGVRVRLQDRGFAADEIERAVAQLLDTGALDDARVARAYARTAATVKRRGRLRVMRELLQMGIESVVASQALGEVYGDLDERSLIENAVRRKLRGRTKLSSPNEYARLYQHLMRQGFSPAGVVAALRRFRAGRGGDQE